MSLSLPSRTDVVSTLRTAGCVFAEAEADLLLAARTADPTTDLDALLAARVGGTPLEHVLGWAAFCGLRVQVGVGVFVPRRRTELLVEVVLGRLRAVPGPPVVVDLCCGAGAIGAAIVAGRRRADQPEVELHAVDLDPEAVSWARRNLAGRGRVWAGDLFAPLPHYLRGRVDLVVASAPYVPTDAIALLPPEARLHEPHQALDGGPDGLDVYRRMILDAPDWLAEHGELAVETSERQAPAVVALVGECGLTAAVVSDDAGSTVVVGARG